MTDATGNEFVITRVGYADANAIPSRHLEQLAAGHGIDDGCEPGRPRADVCRHGPSPPAAPQPAGSGQNNAASTERDALAR